MTLGIVYDLIFVVILLAAAFNGRRRGLVSCAVSLVGAVAGLIVAALLAGAAAGALYDGVIGNALGQTVADALTEQGANLPAVLQQTLGFLPAELLNQVADLLQQTLDKANADLVPVVSQALQPVILPMIQAVLFLILFVVIRWLVSLVAGTLQLVNRLPLVGGLNQVLGLVLGLATGAIDCWMLCQAVRGAAAITGGGVELLSDATLSGSMLYQFFSGFNPFLG